MHKVFFFGASVTAQRKNQAWETTGYFNYCQDYLQKHYAGQFSLDCLASVGGHLDNAGRLLLLDITNRIGPETLVISEWNSTTVWYFPPEILKYYYETLLGTGASVLNLVLPMLSELNSERANIKQVRAAQALGVHQLNLYKEDIDLRACIRDDQHTTTIGGKIYGELVARVIAAIMLDGERFVDDGETLDFANSQASVPKSFNYAFKGTIAAGKCLRVFFGAQSTEKFQIFGNVMSGPWSPTISTPGAEGKIELWNKYTYYENTWETMTALTNVLATEVFPNFVDILVHPDLPNYEALAEGDKKSLNFMQSQAGIVPKLIVSSAIYCDGRPISAAEIV